MTHLPSIPDILREVAAEKIVPRFRALADHEISAKTSPTDLVTIADLEAEEALTRILLDLDPGCAVLGEEAVSKGTALLDIFQTHSGNIWVIDPVDGTHNFATGVPVFGTMLALVRGGETIASWIYDIPGARMGAAEAGAGVTLDGRPVDFGLPEDAKPLAEVEGFLSTKFIPARIKPQVLEKVGALKSHTAMWCAAHEYLALLEGRRDFSFYTRIKPWDHLAGSLMINEAGGESKKWDGARYAPGEVEGGLINARNPNLWPVLQRHFVL